MEDDKNVDYYDLVKNENYQTLARREIQAQVARDQAMKYVNNQNNAMGLGTQGASETSMLGIQGNYGKEVASARSDYNAANNEIEMKRLEDAKNKQNSDFQALTTLMSNTESSEDLDKVITRYGMQIGEDGTLSGDFFDSLDPSSQKQLQVYYDMTHGQFNSEVNAIAEATANRESYSTADELKGMSLEDGSKGSDVSNEIKYITSNTDFLNTLTNGKVVMLQNGSNSNKKVYLMFNNGVWYKVDATVFNNSTNREIVKGK